MGRTNEKTIEERIFEILVDGAHGTIAAAESCTGGGVAARLTSVAGSSAYMLGGIVAYANSAKEHLLGVDRSILESYGAVSEECAIAMAEGARRAFGATWAVSTTGIAGPTGATASKPVGLVYVAVAGPSGSHSGRHLFPGDRADITATTIEAALQLLLEAITGR